MNDNDWRDCFAMFRSVTGASPDECYIFAEAMLISRNKEELKMPVGNKGIVAVKRSSTKKEK